MIGNGWYHFLFKIYCFSKNVTHKEYFRVSFTVVKNFLYLLTFQLKMNLKVFDNYKKWHYWTLSKHNKISLFSRMNPLGHLLLHKNSKYKKISQIQYAEIVRTFATLRVVIYIL